MKRVISVVLALVMSMFCVACGSGEGKNAFTASKSAYESINSAYKITEQFGSDVYEAWRLGIYEKDEILDDGVAYLADELSLTEKELCAGIAYAVADILGYDWAAMTEEEKNISTSKANTYISVMEDKLFSFCVKFVSDAYFVNGKVDEVQGYLDVAKSQMKELSEKYSDYEHYPNLKGYYTTTRSFFEFCQDPTGSFDQVKTTINDYKNEARDFASDLDYIFED